MEHEKERTRHNTTDKGSLFAYLVPTVLRRYSSCADYNKFPLFADKYPTSSVCSCRYIHDYERMYVIVGIYLPLICRSFTRIHMPLSRYNSINTWYNRGVLGITYLDNLSTFGFNMYMYTDTRIPRYKIYSINPKVTKKYWK